MKKMFMQCLLPSCCSQGSFWASVPFWEACNTDLPQVTYHGFRWETNQSPSDDQGFRLAPLTELGVELPPLPYYLQPKVEKKPSESEDAFQMVCRQKYPTELNFLNLFQTLKLSVELPASSWRSAAQQDAFDLHRCIDLFYFTQSILFKPIVPTINPALPSLYRIKFN